VTGRVVVTVYCRGKGRHALAKLLATPDGLHVRIPHTAIGRPSGNRVVNRRGGELIAPLADPDDPDLSMIWLAMCAEGVHTIRGAELARANDTRTTVITVAPVLR
jgi:hypothetical protein